MPRHTRPPAQSSTHCNSGLTHTLTLGEADHVDSISSVFHYGQHSLPDVVHLSPHWQNTVLLIIAINIVHFNSLESILKQRYQVIHVVSRREYTVEDNYRAIAGVRVYRVCLWCGVVWCVCRYDVDGRSLFSDCTGGWVTILPRFSSCRIV